MKAKLAGLMIVLGLAATVQASDFVIAVSNVVAANQTELDRTTYTGREGEIVFNVTSNNLTVYDGSTVGGFPIGASITIVSGGSTGEVGTAFADNIWIVPTGASDLENGTNLLAVIAEVQASTVVSNSPQTILLTASGYDISGETITMSQDYVHFVGFAAPTFVEQSLLADGNNLEPYIPVRSAKVYGSSGNPFTFNAVRYGSITGIFFEEGVFHEGTVSTSPKRYTQFDNCFFKECSVAPDLGGSYFSFFNSYFLDSGVFASSDPLTGGSGSPKDEIVNCVFDNLDDYSFGGGAGGVCSVVFEGCLFTGSDHLFPKSSGSAVSVSFFNTRMHSCDYVLDVDAGQAVTLTTHHFTLNDGPDTHFCEDANLTISSRYSSFGDYSFGNTTVDSASTVFYSYVFPVINTGAGYKGFNWDPNTWAPY